MQRGILNKFCGGIAVEALVTNVINNICHVIWFYCITLEPKYSRKKTAGIAVCAGLFMQIITLGITSMRMTGVLSYSRVPSIWVYFAGYLLSMFVFGGAYVFIMSASHPVKSIFAVSSYYSLWTLIYIIVSIATGAFSGTGNFAVWGLRIVLNLFLLVWFEGYFKKRIQRVYKRIQSGYGVVAAISVFTFITMTILIFYHDRERRYDLFYVVMMLTVSSMMVVIHMLLFHYISQSNYAYRLKQIRNHEKFLMAQIDSYEQMERKARQTRHDFRHHNLVVAEYAKRGDCQSILSYIQEYEQKEEEKYANDYCKNQAVNTVLSVYTGRAKQEKIKVSVNSRFYDNGRISDYDLVSILANMLENAVNACRKVENGRRMEVSLTQKGSKLILICRNSCVPDIQFEEGLPKGVDHEGVGVESIVSCAAKYAGSVDFAVKDGIFTCHVILNY